jgi:hypothetical protein
MEKKKFNALLESIQQGGKILKGKRKTNRKYVKANQDPKAKRKIKP